MTKDEFYLLLTALDHMPYGDRLKLEDAETSPRKRRVLALYRAAIVSDRAQLRMYVKDGHTSENCTASARKLVARVKEEISGLDPHLFAALATQEKFYGRNTQNG